MEQRKQIQSIGFILIELRNLFCLHQKQNQSKNIFIEKCTNRKTDEEKKITEWRRF